MKGLCLLLVLCVLKEAQPTGRPKECGLPSWKREQVSIEDDSDEGLIFEKIEVNVIEHPWAVSFVTFTLDSSGKRVTVTNHCTGSIVSSDTIITAAHCVDDEKRNEGTDLVMGTAHPEDLLEVPWTGRSRNVDRFFNVAITRTIKQHWIHDGYKTTRPQAYFDVAIVRMNEPIDFTDANRHNVFPICLPLTADCVKNEDQWSIDRLVDRAGTFVGFGFDEQRVQDHKTSFLTQAYGPLILSASKCEELHNLAISNKVNDFRNKSVPKGFQEVFCAQNPFDRNSGLVLGDSGGPFMTYQSQSDKSQLIGIFHGKADTAQKYPEVFVPIGKPDIFDDVIEQAFGSDSVPTPSPCPPTPSPPTPPPCPTTTPPPPSPCPTTTPPTPSPCHCPTTTPPPGQECQTSFQNRTEVVYEEEYERVCQRVNKTQCNTVYVQQCAPQQEVRQCDIVTTQKCDSGTEEKCEDVWREETQPYTDQECWDEPILSKIFCKLNRKLALLRSKIQGVKDRHCRQVPWEKCYNAPEELCKSVPQQQQCSEVPQKKCNQVPIQKCKRVKKKIPKNKTRRVQIKKCCIQSESESPIDL